jgi:hypothetical protein
MTGDGRAMNTFIVRSSPSIARHFPSLPLVTQQFASNNKTK